MTEKKTETTHESRILTSWCPIKNVKVSEVDGEFVAEVADAAGTGSAFVE